MLVSDVHAGSVRAVNYAHSLGIRDTRAISFAFDDAQGYDLRREWANRNLRIPLEVDAAPYRDLRHPLLAYLQELKDEDPGAVVVLVMPEVIVRGPQRLLHNYKLPDGVAIVDANDLRRAKTLGASPHVDRAAVERALIGNPHGNGDEQTPLVVLTWRGEGANPLVADVTLSQSKGEP